MGLFGKSDVMVKCFNTEELGKLLHWMRLQQGLSGLSHNRFSVVTAMRSPLSPHPNEVLYFEVMVPHYMYAKLRDKFLEERAFTEVLLQEQVFNEITGRQTP